MKGKVKKKQDLDLTDLIDLGKFKFIQSNNCLCKYSAQTHSKSPGQLVFGAVLKMIKNPMNLLFVLTEDGESILKYLTI